MESTSLYSPFLICLLHSILLVDPCDHTHQWVPLCEPEALIVCLSVLSRSPDIDRHARSDPVLHRTMISLPHAGPYAIFILISEILGTSSLFPYAILLCRGTYPSGSKGLPAAAAASGEDGDVTEPADECNEKR